MKTKQETKAKSEGLELTERQVEDFTRLAQLQKDGAANIKDRVRVGNLRVWIEVTRAIHAEIVG